MRIPNKKHIVCALLAFFFSFPFWLQPRLRAGPAMASQVCDFSGEEAAASHHVRAPAHPVRGPWRRVLTALTCLQRARWKGGLVGGLSHTSVLHIMTSGSVLHLTGGDTAGGGDWARVGTVRGWVSSAVVFPTSVDAWDGQGRQCILSQAACLTAR